MSEEQEFIGRPSGGLTDGAGTAEGGTGGLGGLRRWSAVPAVWVAGGVGGAGGEGLTDGAGTAEGGTGGLGGLRRWSAVPAVWVAGGAPPQTAIPTPAAHRSSRTARHRTRRWPPRTGRPVHERRGLGRLPRRQSRRQQRTDHPGQHVTGPGGGRPGLAGRDTVLGAVVSGYPVGSGNGWASARAAPDHRAAVLY